MKFSELKIGDRFRLDGFGQPLDVIYEKLDDDYTFDHNSITREHYQKVYIGDKISFESDTDVEKLGPAVDSELGEAIKAFLKERMRVKLEKHNGYYDEGIKLTLSIDDEVIHSDKVVMKILRR